MAKGAIRPFCQPCIFFSRIIAWFLCRVLPRQRQWGRLSNEKRKGCMTMKNIFRVLAQSETFQVPSQKAEGGQIDKCNIVLQELGGKYENSYVATILGDQAKVRFAKDNLVVASLRFSTREYNGQVYQDIMVGEIIKLN